MALQWTSANDVRDRWVGGDVPATDEVIEALLEDAEDTILREFPDLPDRIDDDVIPVRRVQKVAARMVMRHLRNPSGVRATQDAAGPFQQSVTFGGDAPGALYLTDDDRRELGGTKTGRAFMVDMAPNMLNPTPDPYPWSPA